MRRRLAGPASPRCPRPHPFEERVNTGLALVLLVAVDVHDRIVGRSRRSRNA
jgi:hypothetical protein